MGKKAPKIGLILIITLSAVLRLINLNQSLWLDEASQAQMSLLSVEKIWSGRPGDFHPPLFYLFSHFWIQVSHTEIWLRLPSVFFGVLCVWFVYRFAELLYPDRPHAPLIAGFLMAIAPFHIYYSQEFRSYSLMCLLATISMFEFYKKNYFRSSIFNLLLLYTHYSSVFIILTQIIIWVIYYRAKAGRFFISLSFMLIGYLPWAPQLFSQLKSGISIDQYLPGWSSVLSIAPLKTLPVILFKLVAGRINFLSKYLYGIYIVFIFGVFFSGIVVAAKKRSFLLTWLFVPVFLLMFTSLILPQSQPFRVIYVLPAIILLLTQACLRFPRIFLTTMLYIALVGNISYFTRPRLQREQWRQAIQYIVQNSDSQSEVVVKFSDKFAPFYWYDPGLLVKAVVPTFPAEESEVQNKIGQIGPEYHKLFVLEYLGDLTDPNRVVDTLLQKDGYTETSASDFSGVGIIRVYQRI